ncbi:nicotinate-nucleotide diphosphorylase (carboxylating) [Cycloclasticus sp. 46_83_sub15_T18]|nr:nicotinate-nucleotide diphosphorylase (carboxylating) [Cycloclasticus sp. 46_83_sub15_T18]
MLDRKTIQDDVKRFLAEDVGSGDLTAQVIAADKLATATLITREAMLVCGQAWFDAVFNSIDENIQVDWQCQEGEQVFAGDVLCYLSGSARGLLTGERAALNMLQTLSATASLANQYAKAVNGTNAVVLDTRKTIPGLRLAQKYAVSCGGASNHRIGLYDGILIKENHIMAAGSIAKAVAAARLVSDSVDVEVEVESLAEVRQALEAKADILLLDNFTLDELVQAVELNNRAAKLEASGNVNLSTIRDIAKTGVDFISVGALTKNVQAVDLSMRINIEA